MYVRTPFLVMTQLTLSTYLTLCRGINLTKEEEGFVIDFTFANGIVTNLQTTTAAFWISATQFCEGSRKVH